MPRKAKSEKAEGDAGGAAPAPVAKPARALDNKALAAILYEVGDLMEIDGADPFRIRSYRRAAEAIEAVPQQISDLIAEPKKLLEIPGIGRGMQANLLEIFREGKLGLHEELLQKYRPSMLELLKISGLGPKTIALLWSAFQVCDLDGVEKLAKEGKIRELPRMGEKHEQKILKSIEDYRRISGRFCLDDADRVAEKLMAHIHGMPGVEKITPAGSLRRGRETVGDLDVLVTGPLGSNREQREAVIERIVGFPGILQVLARGDNKVSFKLRGGMQVDVRLLPPESFGAALQYFTGSKQHNVTLRQRALKMGYTLSEYGLDRLPPKIEGEAEAAAEAKRKAGPSPKEGNHGAPAPPTAGDVASYVSTESRRVAGATEEEIYRALGLDYIEPELRENCGEIEAAAEHRLPALVTEQDIQGDVHMHTVATDGKNTIEEMIEAARARGYRYMAITDHSKNLAFANGLDDKRAEEHLRKIRATAKQFEGITCFAGIEVDILQDGTLDLSDPVLEQMDVVIASVHSFFGLEPAAMTERLLRAIANKNVSVVGHPTGRILLRRDAYSFDVEQVMAAAAKNRVALELNAYPDRLDLCDRHLRLAKERGVKTIINTDAHHTSHMEKIRYGVLQARRAWLTKDDVLNTLPVERFARAMKHEW